MAEAIVTADQAKIDALILCNFNTQTGKLEAGSCATINEALGKLKNALKHRAKSPEPNFWDAKGLAQPPVWAPPRMKSTVANDSKKTPYANSTTIYPCP